jgi:GGDEF domain-containing protein
MPRGVGILALTAGSRLGPGIVFTDILALSLAFAAFAAGAILVPWRRFDDHWLLTLVAIPVVYVASLNALTGAGDSPYSALYAPILAIAGWYLAGRQVVAAIGLVVATEIWRAAAIDGSGSIDVLTIALPFYATLAIIAALTGRWLRASLIATRRDQVRTAAALDAVRGLGTDPEVDVPRQLEGAAASIFRCEATVIRFGARRPSNLDLSTRLLDQRSATVLLPGAHRLHGMLRLDSQLPFTAHDLRLASILAEAAGRTMDASETLEQTRADTERDALTGLLNRRALDRDLGRAMDDASRVGAEVALLFIDLDAFKELNDAHGHATGDAVLVRLGGVFRACARRGDGVYRYGGDEFSIGLAVPGPDASAADLLAEADAAMYAAKRVGGGVVRVSADDMDPA